MNQITAGPPIPTRTRRKQLANEAALLRRQGPRRWYRGLRNVQRFNDSVRRMEEPELPLHPESYCHLCERPNPVWFTENEIWNRATIHVPYGKAAILCPSCFNDAWLYETGQSTTWKITPAR